MRHDSIRHSRGHQRLITLGAVGGCDGDDPSHVPSPTGVRDDAHGWRAGAAVTDLGTIGGLAVDGDWVYVAATEAGRILRVAKDGSASAPGAPITGPCPMPLGSASEIAATPRADTNLELLALQLDGDVVVATQATYERVVADVAAIRAAEPELAGIGYFPPHDGRSLMLSLTDMAARSVEAGDYPAWGCLNDFYGVVSLRYEPSTLVQPWVELVLKGTYDIAALAALYEQLPGVRDASATVGGGDGPTICALRSGATIEYVVDRTGGDCPAGCTEHEAHHFRSSAPGIIETLEVWSSARSGAAPDWFTRVCAN